MRKIVTLILVLGIVSMASADLTWTTTGGADLSSISLLPGASMTVRIANDDTASGGGTVWTYSPDSAVALLTAPSVLTAAGNGASVVNTWTTQLWIEWEAKHTGDPPTTITTGGWLELTIAAPSTAVNLTSANVNADYYAASAGRGTSDLLTVNIIPEPATIALLGLGALLLRRRK